MSLKAKSYVLNLKRRPDRLSRFQDYYNSHGPNLPLIIFEAIDGSNPEQIDRVPDFIKNSISDINDYNNKLSIKYTAFGHLLLWKEIAENGDDYGIIFEDDCHFRPDNNLLPKISAESMKTKWNKVIEEYCNNFKDRKNILYFGVGDLLPIHTVPPSESILIAQESNHVLRLQNKYYGKPNFKSPYVYSWIGCSSYIISKNTAKYLLAIAQKQPIRFAVDAWLKRLYEHDIINIYFTIPLFTYTPDVLDSNTSFPEKGFKQFTQ
jgi:GR25 family glycosyltransferase involved in LPS biosynthesis